MALTAAETQADLDLAICSFTRLQRVRLLLFKMNSLTSHVLII